MMARTPHDSVLSISPGMVESGEITGGETKVHQMNLSIGGEDKHDFNVRLHLISGEADLYMKSCEEGKPCGLSKEDLQRKPD